MLHAILTQLSSSLHTTINQIQQVMFSQESENDGESIDNSDSNVTVQDIDDALSTLAQTPIKSVEEYFIHRENQITLSELKTYLNPLNIEQLCDFLGKRWDRIRGTSLSYNNRPDNIANKICLKIAQISLYSSQDFTLSLTDTFFSEPTVQTSSVKFAEPSYIVDESMFIEAQGIIGIANPKDFLSQLIVADGEHSIIKASKEDRFDLVKGLIMIDEQFLTTTVASGHNILQIFVNNVNVPAIKWLLETNARQDMWLKLDQPVVLPDPKKDHANYKKVVQALYETDVAYEMPVKCGDSEFDNVVECLKKHNRPFLKTLQADNPFLKNIVILKKEHQAHSINYTAYLYKLKTHLYALKTQQHIMEEKGEHCKKYEDAAQSAQNLIMKFEDAIKIFSNIPNKTQQDLENFQATCKDAIRITKPVLDEHRQWHTRIANFLLELITYPLSCLLRKDGLFSLKTKSGELVQALSDAVKNVHSNNSYDV